MAQSDEILQEIRLNSVISLVVSEAGVFRIVVDNCITEDGASSFETNTKTKTKKINKLSYMKIVMIYNKIMLLYNIYF